MFEPKNWTVLESESWSKGIIFNEIYRASKKLIDIEDVYTIENICIEY